MIEGQWEDFEKCFEQQHLESVREAIGRHFPEWFAKYAGNAAVGKERFIGKRRCGLAQEMDPAQRIGQRLAEAVAFYRSQQRSKYDLIAPDCLEEYEGQARQFVRDAVSRMPVIHKAVYSALDEMTWWKKRFHAVTRRRPTLFYQLVRGLVEFADEYASRWKAVGGFEEQRDPHALGLTAVEPGTDGQVEEDACCVDGMGAIDTTGGISTARLWIPGVVGLGISSMILHYRQPAFFAARSRHALAALHFLCGRETAGLETSEFLIWSVSSGDLGHNYAYPFRLFTIHLLEVSRLLEDACQGMGIYLDPDFRMVYVMDFLMYIADDRAEETASWKGEPDGWDH